MIFQLLYVTVFLGLVADQGNAVRVGSASKQDWMEHVVNLFNDLFFNANISFVYDFGSGVPLIHGQATVSIWTPIKLLFNSGYSPINKGTLYDFEVFLPMIHIDHPFEDPAGYTGFQMENCRLQLKFESLTNWNGNAYSNSPTKVWLSSCDRIAYYDGKPVACSAQVLPFLSEALLVEAQEQLSYQADFLPPYNYLQKWSTFQEEMLYSIVY